jgi:hypothetical protein
MRTNTQELTYKWIADAGHAWLEVSMDEINALNISDKISSYSYVKGETAYLEEDCDASIFLDALRARLPNDEPVKFICHHINGDAPCRRFKRFGQ